MIHPFRPITASCALALAFAFGAPSGAARAQDNTEASRQSSPLAAATTARSAAGAIRVEVVAGGLVHPWGMALLPDGRVLVTERNTGQLRIVSRQDGASAPVEGVPPIFRFQGDTGRSQAGLFDVLLHPGFAGNGLVYLSLSSPTERGTGTTVVRGRLVEEEGKARLADLETIFAMNEADQDSSGLHFGGRLALDAEDGTLFLTIGDRRNISRAQDPEDQAGSILRIGLDGQVPADNPFAGRDGHDPKIYSLGSRHSQALALHPRSGQLWSVEHGPKGGDRVDVIKAGANHGWPYLAAGPDYSGAPVGVGTRREGMTGPVHVFEGTVAPSGAVFYEGGMFPDWQGDLLVGGLVSQGLLRLEVEGEQVKAEERIEIGRRIRDVMVAPDGAVWLLTEHAEGELLRLTRQPG